MKLPLHTRLSSSHTWNFGLKHINFPLHTWKSIHTHDSRPHTWQIHHYTHENQSHTHENHPHTHEMHHTHMKYIITHMNFPLHTRLSSSHTWQIYRYTHENRSTHMALWSWREVKRQKIDFSEEGPAWFSEHVEVKSLSWKSFISITRLIWIFNSRSIASVKIHISCVLEFCNNRLSHNNKWKKAPITRRKRRRCKQVQRTQRNRMWWTLKVSPHTHTHTHSHPMLWLGGNRQARVALGDRRKYSLQLTALRLNPRRLRGVQALT
jgi:hypothetical protein